MSFPSRSSLLMLAAILGFPLLVAAVEPGTKLSPQFAIDLWKPLLNGLSQKENHHTVADTYFASPARSGISKEELLESLTEALDQFFKRGVIKWLPEPAGGWKTVTLPMDILSVQIINREFEFTPKYYQSIEQEKVAEAGRATWESFCDKILIPLIVVVIGSGAVEFFSRKSRR